MQQREQWTCTNLEHTPCDLCGGFHPPIMRCEDGPCCDLDRQLRPSYGQPRSSELNPSETES